MKCFLKIFTAFFLAAVFAGCTRAVPHVAGPPPRVADIPAVTSLKFFGSVDAWRVEFDDDLDFDLLQAAINHSISYYENAGREKAYLIDGRLIDAAKLTETLLAFKEIVRLSTTAEGLNSRIAADFDVYRVVVPGQSLVQGNALFTGYYEPLLHGSFYRTGRYKYPIYQTPPDLIIRPPAEGKNVIGRMENGEFVSYYNRAQIDIEGVLLNQGLELIWVDDAVELFSLHIQGSGKVKLEDGKLLTVTYAQNNGWPFRSVTRFMLDAGRISGPDASYRNFKTFLGQKTDEELFETLSYNERYIFFRFSEGEPVGSLGTPVTPGRSIATDPDYFPEGALAFIRLTKPVFDARGNILRRIPFSRFVLSQDKGAAIKGPGRVDLFCGFGEEAQATAGTLKERGELYLLIKK